MTKKENEIEDTPYLMFVLTFALIFSLSTTAESGESWSNQYCDIKLTTIRIVDQNSVVTEEKTEEKVVCEDGVKDFLHGMGIAESCLFFTWQYPVNNVLVKERSIACQRMDGGYEIVPGYHNIQ